MTSFSTLMNLFFSARIISRSYADEIADQARKTPKLSSLVFKNTKSFMLRGCPKLHVSLDDRELPTLISHISSYILKGVV